MLPPKPSIPEFLWRLQGLVAPLELLEQAHRELGDVFQSPYSDASVVCVSSPTGLQKIFSAPPEVLQSSQNDTVFRLVLGENALVFLQGDRHRKHRQLMMPTFHGEALAHWAADIVAITQQALSQLQPGQNFAVRPVMKSIALRTILKVVFGMSEGDRFERLYAVLNNLFQGLDSPLSAVALVLPWLRVDLGNWSPWGHFLNQQQEINQLIRAEIQYQQSRSPRTDSLLSILLSAKDEQGESLSQAELADELLMLVFAGYETTTSAIVWALYWTVTLPTVKKQLEMELWGRSVDQNPVALSRLPYLSAVCNETLRIHPVAIGCFSRQVIGEPFNIDGFDLPVGTIIHPSIYLAHRNPSIYPAPEQFNPERFLKQAFSAFEFLPFGGGQRRCVGAAFALLEMKLILATVLKQVQLRRIDSTTYSPVRYGITMAPPFHLQMQLVGRW